MAGIAKAAAIKTTPAKAVIAILARGRVGVKTSAATFSS